MGIHRLPHANRCNIRRNRPTSNRESSVPLPSEETGWLDVYISGTDLAGNPVIGGGDAEQPYARIHVQPIFNMDQRRIYWFRQDR